MVKVRAAKRSSGGPGGNLAKRLLGVRPCADRFTWVRRSFLLGLGSGLGTVVTDRGVISFTPHTCEAGARA